MTGYHKFENLYMKKWYPTWDTIFFLNLVFTNMVSKT